ncbi:IrmA family protein, partial [Escherichia coli]|nr:IrmA family protein [Escherichia coli]
MIHQFKTCIITGVILGLTWSAPLRAQDQRYISIRNTDTIWLPGNICAYQFRLDNGGNDEGFGPLTITLQLKDKYGQTLVTRKMETEAFGDSNATRTTDAFLETECVEN